jgi:hypothetical protein
VRNFKFRTTNWDLAPRQSTTTVLNILYFQEPKIIPTNHITETDSELIFERSEDLVAADSVNKKVIAAYNDEGDGVVNRPVIRRASDREMHSLIEDEEITNPVQVEIAQTVKLDNQKMYMV